MFAKRTMHLPFFRTFFEGRTPFSPLFFHTFRTFLYMLPIPTDMCKVNAYVFADIPSARDLYNKMGFRYLTGRGHNSIENAESAMPCDVRGNASIEHLYGVSDAITSDIESLKSENK